MSVDITILDEPSSDRIPPKVGIAAAAVVGVAMAASYWPSLANLVYRWSDEPNYSHGFLVAPIAAFILWKRKDGLASVPIRPNAWGFAALLGLVAFRAYLYERNMKWIEDASILAVVMSLILALGGWGLLRWSLPGVLFLVFLFPLPQWVNAYLASPLQTIATMASAALLQASGLPVLYEGHIIYVGVHPLEVARACNGLSMLLSFVALVTAMTILVDDRPTWQRVALMASTIPIALVANVLRIAATAWCYHLFGEKVGENIAHAGAGWAMMPVGLLLVFVELSIFSWLVVEEEEAHAATIYMRPVIQQVIKK